MPDHSLVTPDNFQCDEIIEGSEAGLPPIRVGLFQITEVIGISGKLIHVWEVYRDNYFHISF